MNSYRCHSRDIEIPMDVIEDLTQTERLTPYSRTQNFASLLSGRTSNSSLFRLQTGDSKGSPRFPLLSPKSSQSFGSYASPRRSLAGQDRVPLTVLRGYVLQDDTRQHNFMEALPPVQTHPNAGTPHSTQTQRGKIGKKKLQSNSKRSRYTCTCIKLMKISTRKIYFTLDRT